MFFINGGEWWSVTLFIKIQSILFQTFWLQIYFSGFFVDFILLQDFDPYEEFPGTSPFSEPEVQIMRKISRSFNPHVWVNVHSGMEVNLFLNL